MKVEIFKEGNDYLVEIPPEIIKKIDISKDGKCRCVMKKGEGQKVFDCRVIEE